MLSYSMMRDGFHASQHIADRKSRAGVAEIRIRSDRWRDLLAIAAMIGVSLAAGGFLAGFWLAVHMATTAAGAVCR